MKIISVFAWVLVVAGIGVMLYKPGPGAELPLLAGLFISFMVNPKVTDERLISLKASSAYTALIAGYGVKLITSNLFSHELISWQLTEINHFLILVFALALLIYHGRVYLSAH